MMKNRKLMMGFFCATAVSGAAVAYAANGGVSVGWSGSYQNLLAQAYSDLASLESGDETDFIDARELNARALSAYHGNDVAPLAPDQVRAVQSSPASLENDYMRIQRVRSNQELRAQNPLAVALVQANYDCYLLHQQNEPNASHNLNQCERDYQRLIAQLDRPVPPPVASSAPTTVMYQYDVVDSREVFFAWNRATLDEAGRNTLDALKMILNTEQNGVKRIALEGYADRSGPARYNQRLSQRRAAAVASYLGVVPVENEKVDLRAYGETNLPVSTPDGQREPRNRLVKIHLVQEKTEQSTTP